MSISRRDEEEFQMDEELKILQAKWTPKAIRKADEAGLLYTFNPNTDPNWEEKMDKLQSGELIVKNGQLVPSKLITII